MRHPYGIWNKHSPRKASKTSDYETSLWDLKLSLLGAEELEALIMRHPYGIWNWCCFGRYAYRGCIMRHPYGIWNSLNACLVAPALTLWDIPMGFETKNNCEMYPYQKLWDIPMGFETGWWCTCASCAYIMRHPYGIWNMVNTLHTQ